MQQKLNALEEQFKKDKETADQIFEEQRKVKKKKLVIKNPNIYYSFFIELRGQNRCTSETS